MDLHSTAREVYKTDQWFGHVPVWNAQVSPQIFQDKKQIPASETKPFMI